jgi:iron complex transport system substrate-binding protein
VTRRSLPRLALLCAALLLPASGTLAGTLELLDATGRRVSVATPATRIVSLSPGVTEILFAIGADAALVGVSRHCDYPLAAKLKPKVGDFNQPDLAKIRAAAADLVVFTEQVRPADLAALEEARIAALVLPAATVADIVAAVRTLGEIAGRPAAAAALAAELEKGITAVRDRFADLPEERRPRVYVEVDGPTALYAVGPGSFMDELVRLAGGRNAFAQRQEAYFPVTAREVVEADPQVILVDHPFQYKVGVAKREGWGSIAAVRDGRVHDGTDFDIIPLNRPGPRVLTALRQIIPLLHPGSAP